MIVNYHFITPLSEEECLKIFEKYRRLYIKCSGCGNSKFYWKSDKKEFECKKCRKRTGLKANTMMHRSKLPVHYWVVALDMIINIPNCKAVDIQKVLQHNRYTTIWEMTYIINKQLSRLKNEELRGEVRTFDFSDTLKYEDEVKFFKNQYINNPSNEQMDFRLELLKLLLKWLTNPRLKLGV